MPNPLPRLSLFLPLALTVILAACAASGSRPAAPKAAAKAPATAPKPAPTRTPPPAPRTETPSSSLIVMGAPLPGVPMPVAGKPGPTTPLPEPKPFTPQPSAAVPGEPVQPTAPAPIGSAPATQPFSPQPPAEPTAAGTVPAPFTTGPGAPTAAPAATAAADFSPVPAPGQAPGVPAAAAPQGTPTGYANIAWGTSAKQVPGLVVHDADPGSAIITYTWPSGPQDIVGAPLRDAFLEFYQDRFYHVWLDLTGRQAYETALAGLTAAYGPPTSQNLEKNYHAWTLGDVNVYCAFHATENEGDVSYFYQPIYERLAAARKAGRAKGHPGRRGK